MSIAPVSVSKLPAILTESEARAWTEAVDHVRSLPDVALSDLALLVRAERAVRRLDVALAHLAPAVRVLQ